MINTIFNNRGIDVNEIDLYMNPSENIIPDTHKLIGCHEAANLLYTELIKGGNIVYVTDGDGDGQSAAAMGKRASQHIGFDDNNFTVIVNERKYGNGVNDEMVRRILDINKNRPVDIVLTADHGSYDGPRYKTLKEAGIKNIIVTDHHPCPNGKPESCDIFINPQQAGDTYSKNICGCHVIYLVMLTLYDLVIENKTFNVKVNDRLESLIHILAGAIVVDMMSMRDPINRYYVKKSISLLMNAKDPYLIAYSKIEPLPDYITSDFYGFGLMPLISAANRMGEPTSGYEFMVSDDHEDAFIRVNKLKTLNVKRKAIQNDAIIKALEFCRINKPSDGLVFVPIDVGNGVAGLVANMLARIYSRPAFVLVKSDDGLFYSGSGRSDGSVKLNEVMIETDKKINLYKFGGHSAAGGITIEADKLMETYSVMNKECIRIMKDAPISSQKVDIKLSGVIFPDALYEPLMSCGPFGVDFPRPLISMVGTLIEARSIGKARLHKLITVRDHNDNQATYIYLNSLEVSLNGWIGKEVILYVHISMVKKYNGGDYSISAFIENIKKKIN